MKTSKVQDAKGNGVLVPQEHAWGCAVACVASRCGISYRKALGFFRVEENAWLRGYYCVELVEALAGLGFKYQLCKYEQAKHHELALTPGSIVFVEPNKTYPGGHYLLRTEKGWMNPWKNFPQMIPVEAAYQSELPGWIEYLVFEV